MRNVFAFTGFAKAVSLDGLGEDDGRLPLVSDGGLVGGVDLFLIVSAPQQLAELFITQMSDQLEQFGVTTEEVFSDVTAGLDDILLIIAIHQLFHALEKKSRFVGRDQRIPVGSPNELDDIPSGAAEDTFKFLNDLAIAADGTVEALEIAIHDERQIVEILPRRQGQCAEGFWFVGFAVANKRPDTWHFLDEAACLQISGETRLIQ